MPQKEKSQKCGRALWGGKTAQVAKSLWWAYSWAFWKNYVNVSKENAHWHHRMAILLFKRNKEMISIVAVSIWKWHLVSFGWLVKVRADSRHRHGLAAKLRKRNYVARLCFSLIARVLRSLLHLQLRGFKRCAVCNTLCNRWDFLHNSSPAATLRLTLQEPHAKFASGLSHIS